jgi:hypothetical protein
VINQYIYAMNNPVLFADPSGKSIWDISGGIAAAFVAFSTGAWVGAAIGNTVGGGVLGSILGGLAGSSVGSLAGGVIMGLTYTAQGRDFNAGFAIGAMIGGVFGGLGGANAGYDPKMYAIENMSGQGFNIAGNGGGSGVGSSTYRIPDAFKNRMYWSLGLGVAGGLFMTVPNPVVKTIGFGLLFLSGYILKGTLTSLPGAIE